LILLSLQLRLRLFKQNFLSELLFLMLVHIGGFLGEICFGLYFKISIVFFEVMLVLLL